MRSVYLATVILLSVLLPGRTSAWGDAGHAMVCAIAESRLTDKGTALVAEALDLHSSIDDSMARSKKVKICWRFRSRRNSF